MDQALKRSILPILISVCILCTSGRADDDKEKKSGFLGICAKILLAAAGGGGAYLAVQGLQKVVPPAAQPVVIQNPGALQQPNQANGKDDQKKDDQKKEDPKNGNAVAHGPPNVPKEDPPPKQTAPVISRPQIVTNAQSLINTRAAAYPGLQADLRRELDARITSIMAANPTATQAEIQLLVDNWISGRVDAQRTLRD